MKNNSAIEKDSATTTHNSATPFRLQRPGMALTLLGCLFVFCLIIGGIFISLLPMLMPEKPAAILRISAVIQDLFIFIIPAIGMAMVATRLPARLLAVDRFPDLKPTLVALGVMVASIPAMNLIINWNQNWHFPPFMAAAEEYFRTLEQGATDATEMLLANSTIPSLIISILIVGVLAGFSEELFFRGAMQRVLGMTRTNHHVVIWLVAFIFSAFHFQLFGLIPRLLLGAFFGYALYWTKSLWLPIFLHIFNNTLVVLAEYNKFSTTGSVGNAPDSTTLDTIGSTLSSPLEITAILLSAGLVTYGIYLLRRLCR